MPIGITDEHEDLRASVRRWLTERCPPDVPRALLDSDAEPLPAFWPELVALGWPGLATAEDLGGSGASLVELAVLLEETGRACLPGPLLPTVAVAAILGASTSDVLRKEALRAIAEGAPATLALDPEHVLSGAHAEWFVVPTPDGGLAVFGAADITTTPLDNLDRTRRLVRIAPGSADAPHADRVLAGVTAADAHRLLALLAAAEMVGIAGWCLDTAVAYAKTREQFGRPIGQFQAIKHRCADLLIAVEQARASVWDAASAQLDDDSWPLAVAVAADLATDAAFTAAKDCVQILGGIGFTWEHEAHLYLKRAIALRALIARPWRREVADLALSGVRRTLAVDLGAAAEKARAEIGPEVDALAAIPTEERRGALAEGGWLAPHWPRPYGRDANAVEQVVIDEELRRAKVRVPHLQVAGWALPTIIAHGTAEQQERWCPPTLRGELVWCQLFSEPGAGSDLAALSTRADRVEGGWRINGQKVWTSMAQVADWGILLARTDPDAPKHQGITYFLLDMKAPGIDIRPLRELTGHAMFNEVFFSDVFVPDDCVVGEVNGGWPLARTTLANERVVMGGGSSFTGGLELLLRAVRDGAAATDPVLLDQLGGLIIEAHSLALLSFRTTLRALSGAEPGSESSVRKLLGVEHEQRVSEFGMSLLGAGAATVEGDAATWTTGFLSNRCLTIAGGTSEVQRNVIAERLLGLPRDPEPGQ